MGVFHRPRAGRRNQVGIVAVVLTASLCGGCTLIADPSAYEFVPEGEDGGLSDASFPDSTIPEFFTVGGDVSGLVGSGLVLQNQGSDDLAVNANGPFTFASPLPDGSIYSVTIGSQPEDQSCEVTGGDGVVAGANVTAVMVRCSPVEIEDFTVSEPRVSAGETVTLSWDTRHASRCTIDPGDLPATPPDSGTLEVTVEEAPTFTLTCHGLGGPVQSTVSVDVTDEAWGAVSVGNAHTCAVKADGRLFCWGLGERGQLGNGALASRSTPVEVPGEDWAAVSAGSNHTCALTTDGHLFCWGRGDSGQIGDGSDTDTPTPVQVSADGMDWAAVSAGGHHTCGLKPDRRLFCWGAGNTGQLGNDSTDGSAVPVQVEAVGGMDWAAVSAGGSHTCASTTGGQLYCWGEGNRGELGDGSGVRRLSPVRESTSSTDWSAISTGGLHTCGLRTVGRLFCWGWGVVGQLGNGSTDEGELSPFQESTAAMDWSTISAGGTHTCALKTDGRLFCWGAGSRGRLGNGDLASRSVPVQELTLSLDWATVSAGGEHTCALKTDGRLFCWGRGTNGELGNGSAVDSSIPEQVTDDD